MSQEAKQKKGRPTDFLPEFVEQAEKLCTLGATDMELADFFGVDVRTIYRWRATNPDFCQALRIGKEAADDRVERSLYARALGYEHDEVDIRVINNEVVMTPIRKHYPPETGAAKLWLTNRRGQAWKDKVQQEHTGADGGPIQFDQFSHLPPEQREAALRQAAREALLQLPVEDLKLAIQHKSEV